MKAKARRLNDEGDPVGPWFELGIGTVCDETGVVRFAWPEGVPDVAGQKFHIVVDYSFDQKPFGIMTIEPAK